MATVNSVNTPLSGSTGTGTFVGATSPTISLPLINNSIHGYSTTVTAAGNTTLVVGSNYQQFFTGSTTQSVIMPVTSTLTVGQSWWIVNNSSGIVTVKSSGSNTILAMAGGTDSIVTCIAQSGTTAADWNAEGASGAAGVDSITGTANQVIASASTGAVTLSLPQSIATTSAVTFGNLTFSPTTAGIVGTTTNDATSAGNVGQITSSVIADASKFGISNNTATNVTSISLTAGDWDVWGNVEVVSASTTVLNSVLGWISSTSASLPDASLINFTQFGSTGISNVGTGVVCSVTPPSQRFSLSGTTTIYLSAFTTFTTSTMSVEGGIYARRRR